jgi:flagellar protein FliO/FliZ
MDAVLTMLRVVVSLAAVLGVIWYLHRRVSRRQLRTKKKTNPVTVVGKQGIAAKASVVVVDVDGRRLVLGVTEHSVNVLHSAEQLPVAEASFASVLADASAAGAAAAERPVADADPADAHPVATPASSPVPTASPVAGSILAASTWKLALTSVRNGLK